MRPSSVVLGFAVFAFACRSVTAPDTGGATFAYDFSTGAQGWTSGSSDYGIPIEPEIDLVADWRPLPAPLDQTSHALYIAGSNLSGDLFMFYKKQVDGLSPGRMYVASVTAEIATNIPHGCFGLGGAPGESAYVKASASNHEPMRVLVGTD